MAVLENATLSILSRGANRGSLVKEVIDLANHKLLVAIYSFYVLSLGLKIYFFKKPTGS